MRAQRDSSAEAMITNPAPYPGSGAFTDDGKDLVTGECSRCKSTLCVRVTVCSCCSARIVGVA